MLGETVDLSGAEIPRAPEWTISIDAEVRAPMERFGQSLSPLGEGYFRAEWSYRSKTIPVLESLIPNPQQLIAEEFDLFNLRAGFVTDKFRVSAYVENVFDEVYFTNFGGFGFSGARINPTYRTYGINFNIYFN